jgi:hypothetical protein
MSARKPSALPAKKWTPQANLEFLLAIIKTYNVKINYAEIAAILGNVSAIAVKSQFNKLRREGRKGKTEKDLSGKGFEMDGKEESSDDEDWQTMARKAER